MAGVMKMKDSKEILTSALNTVQMGQIGIRSALDCAIQTDLKQALESQLKEYDAIETQLGSIASSRSWELKEIDPAIRAMSNMMLKMRLIGGDKDSKIAAMMINGNTRGMILGLKNLHRFHSVDPKVENVCQKLLDTEVENIRQMQGFL